MPINKQYIFQTHAVASRHLTVASVLENIGIVGVVNAGSTLQMLQVHLVGLGGCQALNLGVCKLDLITQS